MAVNVPIMDHKPTVSVVVATNRNSNYLVETLESVRGQTWQDYELVVVNHCPNADPRVGSLVASFGGRLLRIDPTGVSEARNVGASACDGSLLVFLDDDDVWHPERLSLQVDALAEAPSAIACFSGGWYMDAAGRTFGTGWPGTSVPSSTMLSGKVPIPRIVALMIRRLAFHKVGGFSPSFRISEDDEFILRLLQEGEIVGIDRQLVGYRRHGGNVTNQAISGRRRSSERLIRLQIWGAEGRGDEDAAELLRENLKAFRRRSAAATVGAAASMARDHDYSTAAKELVWGIAHAPGAVVAESAHRLGLNLTKRS